MENIPTQNSEGSLSAEQIKRLIVNPITRHARDLAKENERLFNGLLFAMETNFDSMTKQISKRLDEIQESIEVIARELARRIPNGDNGKHDS